MSGLTGVTAIAAGLGYHSLALKSDGTVWAWGRNLEGQTGTTPGAVCDRTICVRTPVQVSNLTAVTAIGVGEYHSLAVREDGTVWAWGQSYFGQLGTGTITTTGCFCQPQPAPVLSVSGATAVVGGTEFSAARTRDGAVWTWGGDSFGELGDGASAAANPCGCVAPAAQVPGVAGVAAIAAGAYDLYVTRTDGTLWAWGANFRAQLGNGSSDSTGHAPARIIITRPALTLTPVRSLFPDQVMGTTSGSRDK